MQTGNVSKTTHDLQVSVNVTVASVYTVWIRWLEPPNLAEEIVIGSFRVHHAAVSPRASVLSGDRMPAALR